MMLWVVLCFAIMLVIETGFFCMFALNWLSTLLSHFPLVLFWHFSIRVEEELHRCHKLKNTDELNFCAGWFFELPSPPNDELFHTLQFCHFHNDSVLLRRSENKGSLESKLFHAFFSPFNKLCFANIECCSGSKSLPETRCLCQVCGENEGFRNTGKQSKL